MAKLSSHNKLDRHRVSYFYMAVCVGGFLLVSYAVTSSRLNPFNSIKQQKTLLPRLIIISLDGFRFDYTSAYETPNLNILSSHGIFMPQGLIPVFPTVTWPNHHSIMTGMYPESHGIVGNKMYDPVYDATFTMGNEESRWWNQTEPVWITARRQGLKTGVMCWPGANVEFNGVRANYILQQNHCGSFDDRVKKLVHGLADEKLNFVALYLDQPDLVGHHLGTVNENLGRVVKYMDDVIGHLLLKLLHAGLLDSTDVIITSDHGMADKRNDPDGALLLLKFLDREDFTAFIEGNTMASIRPKRGMENKVYDALKNAHPHVKVYSKEEIPQKYHYKAHRRIPPILAVADEGYGIAMDKLSWLLSDLGKHGYGNELQSMRGIFVAQGPSFKTGRQIESFEIIHLYSLICGILKIEPNVNINSSLSVVKAIFKNG